MDNTKFRAALGAARMTNLYAAKCAGMTVQTMYSRLEKPLDFRLSELKNIYVYMDNTGKKLLVEAINDVFCSET